MTDHGWLIICGVLIFVVLINLGLSLAVLRSRGRRRPLLNGSLSDLLNPWKKEDDALDMLHREISHLADKKTSQDEWDG